MELFVRVLDLIGSAVPIAILCFILATIFRQQKMNQKTLISYIVISVLMFIVLLRT